MIFFIQNKKEIGDITVKDIRNFFRLKNDDEAIKCRLYRDIRKILEHEEDYCTVRVGNFWTNNYIEYESNGDRNKATSIEEYIKKIDHA